MPFCRRWRCRMLGPGALLHVLAAATACESQLSSWDSTGPAKEDWGLAGDVVPGGGRFGGDRGIFDGLAADSLARPSADGAIDSDGQLADQGTPLTMLVFSRTRAFRHGSIAAGVTALKKLAAARGWNVVATEDPVTFTAAKLSRFSVVVWLNTTGDVLDSGQQQAFEQYVRGGGGYVGIHSASDTEYDWSFYGELVGAYFKSHPAIQQARVTIDEQHHPATAMLADPWSRTDEWYNFASNPRRAVTVLLSVDESSYSGGTMGGDHPIAWVHQKFGGRAFYTALGHTAASYGEPTFLAHLAGGIAWASRP